MNEKVAKVIAKINALRAISASTHSKAEQETTLVLAAKLIAEYQLEEAQLSVTQGTTEGIDLDSFSVIYETGKICLWKLELATGIAALNGLFAYNAVIRHAETHRKGNRIRVIGRKSDIEIAIYCMAYLSVLIADLGYDYVPSGNDAKRGVNPVRESWCLGCVRGYLKKMTDARDAVNQSATSTALVFIGNKAMEAEEAWKAKSGITLSRNTRTSKAQFHGATFASGYKRGQTLSVTPGMVGDQQVVRQMKTNKLFDK